MVGLLRAPFVRTQVVPFLTLVALGATAGLGIGTWGDNVSVLEGALRMDDLTLALTMVFVAGAACAVLLSWRDPAPAEAGHGEFYALLLTAVLGMVVLVAARRTSSSVFVGYELLSIPLYVLCATRPAPRALAGVRPEVPDHRLGRLGDAALRPGVRLRRHGLDRLQRHRQALRGGRA